MLKKTALAVFVMIGAAGLGTVTGGSAAAENIRSVPYHGYNAGDHRFHRHHVAWRRVRLGHRVRFGRLIRRVRMGDVVCFRRIDHPRWQRPGIRGYRYYNAHGRRLGPNRVRRLLHTGRAHAMRCFERA